MSLDIGSILKDWPYEPDRVSARRIKGDDGRERIQLRLDLGLIQMELTGRPDGQRPHGCESLLKYHRQRLEKHCEEHGLDEGFELDRVQCELLRAEGVMYYHRYLAAFVLEDYESVKRDAMRNLELFDFCRTYAAEESDRHSLEHHRPYVLMMYSRAKAQVALRNSRPKAALAALNQGVRGIEEFYGRFGQEKLIDRSGEIAARRAMAGQIEAKIPVDPIEKLRGDLSAAVEEERYEDAAALRDKLRRASSEDNE